MSKIVRMEQVTPWKRVMNAARRTIGKKPLDKEPSNEFKAHILLAEHSPIRLLEYDWTWESIKQWVTVHLVRHFIGCQKFVHSQREDRRNMNEFDVADRDHLLQGSLNDMDMTANAQALITISRRRLCIGCASKETREAWQQVKDEIEKIDPILAEKMVPECLYRGFCPEWLNCCGYCNTKKYQEDLKKYRNTKYND